MSTVTKPATSHISQQDNQICLTFSRLIKMATLTSCKETFLIHLQVSHGGDVTTDPNFSIIAFKYIAITDN